MDHHQPDKRTAAVLLVLVALSLLLAFLLVSDGADQPALAQMHPTNMLTRTDTPPFISPRSTPILTQTPLPRPAPQPMGFITNPTEAYVLGQRYGRNARRGEAPDETLIDTSSIIEDARSFSSNTFNFFPLVTTNNAQLWYKGTSKDKAYLESAFLRRLGVSWWYDWQHDYTWGDTGAFAWSQYTPMVWCADMPNEAGVPPGPSDNGKGHWNPQELATRVAQNPGRIWLIFNEPDFPPTDLNNQSPTPTPGYGFQQCGRILCQMANRATLPPVATLPPNTTPTPTRTFTPTPTPPAGATRTPTPTPVWPCWWPQTSPTPAYYNDLQAKMVRIAADRYAQMYRIIKSTDPTSKVFCCGNFFAADTTWWQAFLENLRNYHSDVKIDGVAIHAYPWSISVRNCALVTQPDTIWNCMEPELEQFREDHEAELQQPGTPLVPDAPIWITEIGYLVGPWGNGPTPAATLTYGEVTSYLMTPLVAWLQGGGTGYQAVAWFVSIDNIRETPLESQLFGFVPAPATPSALTTPGSTWASIAPPTVTPSP